MNLGYPVHPQQFAENGQTGTWLHVMSFRLVQYFYGKLIFDNRQLQSLLSIHFMQANVHDSCFHMNYSQEELYDYENRSHHILLTFLT